MGVGQAAHCETNPKTAVVIHFFEVKLKKWIGDEKDNFNKKSVF
jgi:hypothetical protein